MQEALDYHRKGKKGKTGTELLKPCDKDSLSLAYTPGVASPCLEIAKDKSKAYEYTNKGHTVAVVTNGTAVLGLGDIGALAGKPVMEGKCVLFKCFADVDAVDVLIDSKDPEEIVNIVQAISPTYGGINLEDIKAPECFYIEEKLRDLLDIPVFHDDQHGTAIVTCAGLLNALKIARKEIEQVKIVFSGAGAAAIACAKLFCGLGAKKENIVMCDSKGVINKERDVNEFKAEFATDKVAGGLGDVIKDADVFIGLSVKDALTSDMLNLMEENPIVFAMANPDPEIKPELAHETRNNVIMATGRSDYPNQVNNVLAFPFVFRGTFDVRAKEINEEMKVAAAKALAKIAKEDEKFGKDYIIPEIWDKHIAVEVSFEVAKAAMETSVAREAIDLELYKNNLRRKFLDD